MNEKTTIRPLILAILIISLPIFLACIIDNPDLSDEKFTPPEWWETEGVWLSWTSDTDYISSMALEIAEICKVYIITSDSNDQSQAENKLSSYGVNMSNVEYYIYKGNYGLSIWMRDFGPIYVFDNDNRKILDFYHSYHCNDMPIQIGNFSGDTVIDANDIELPGGNYISNGTTSFVSDAIYDPTINEGNDYEHNIINFDSKEDLLSALSNYTGNDDNESVKNLDHERTHHIDMWAKQLTPDTFIVGKYSLGENVAILNEVTTQLENLGFTVVRINQPEQYEVRVTPEILKHHRNAEYLKETKAKDIKTTLTYTNSLIVNAGDNGKKVLVPSYSDYTTLNNNAKSVYESILPDYEIVMIDSSEIILYGGAIHCTTMRKPKE